MPVKRRNHGRSKKNRGHCHRFHCHNCHQLVAKDKAIKRFQVRNVVDASVMNDLRDHTALEGYAVPKLYYKQVYCVGCAIHRRIVRVRSHEDRKIRTQPRRFRRFNVEDKPAQKQDKPQVETK
eukprot:gnl/Chilomastix_caulleri/7655.p1 GENE.gnl/Chilomastix_caulleri/7655~~gnl/Chilomastix_caulleri/7655.p1  ORF type:complete len:123 (+),score=23.02 gnl/Chilomastix_caulleri/7655:52-420(+)